MLLPQHCSMQASRERHEACHRKHRQRPLALMQWRALWPALTVLLSVGSLVSHCQALRGLRAQEQRSDEVAVCAIVRDQQEGLREWVEWHKGLGVGRFYIMDYDSSKPTGREIADHISSGVVDLFYRCPTYTTFQFRRRAYISNLQETTRYPQLYVYDICLTKFGEYHKWMAFLDVDEFLVLQPGAGARKLPEFLQGFNDYGGLVTNMRVFGSSGFKSRPQGSILRNYLKCLPEQHEENKKVRSLVHTALDPALHMLTPHNVRFRDKFYAVDEAKKPVKESFSTPRVSTEKIALHKYPLKTARAVGKKGKSDGSSGEKSGYYVRFDREANEMCDTGKLAYAAAADA